MLTRNDHPDAATDRAPASRSLDAHAIPGRDGDKSTAARVKRPLDIALSLCALFLLLPALALIVVLVLASGPGPVICSRPRYGRNRKVFRMYRFRTKGPDGRLTRIGAFLCRTNLDELPEFVNVLKADMSIVGPRPYAPFTMIDGMLYETLVADFESRHAIRPGMTSLARVSGCRGPIPPEAAAIERFRDDLAYVRQQSLLLDIRIIAKSLWRGFLTGRAV